MANAYAAGRNANYDLGLGDNVQRNTFSQVAGDWLVVKSNSSESFKSGVGIKSDGTLWGWGNNAYKQLGLPNFSYTDPTQIGTDTDWVDISLGDFHLLARKADGSIWSCGDNAYGQCGLGHFNTPVSTLTKIGTDAWIKISACGSSSLGIKSGGTLWGWGYNDAIGLLGVNTTTYSYSSPTQDATASALWSDVSLCYSHALAVRSDGSLWSWGENLYGQLGHGDHVTRITPTQVGSVATWTKVRAGTTQTSYAIRSDGSMWACGAGGFGGLGTGNTSDQLSFIQIGSTSDWSDVAPGSYCLSALKTTGELYVAGRNNYGQLGTGTTTDVPTLTNVSLSITPISVQAGWGAVFLIASPPPPPSLAIAPITINVVHPTGAATAPLRIDVVQTGVATAPLSMAVVDTLFMRDFTLAVAYNGADITAQVTGQVVVDAEEGAARVMTLTIKPAAGAIDPVALSGGAITLDAVRILGGVPVPTRVFTGRVDLPVYDPVTRLIKLSCTDDLQNAVARLTKAEIEHLTGGQYHAGAQGVIDEHWQYAEALMETVAGSLDCGPSGAPRVTLWDGLPVWRTFAQGDVIDATPGIELPRRREICNRVNISYEYRYYRLRERHAWLSWSASIIGVDAYASGYRLPSYGDALSALQGTGWEILSTAYATGYTLVSIGKPIGAPAGADGDWWINGGGGISNLSAHLALRYAQTVTESYVLTVSAPASVAANGLMAQDLRGALATSWSPSGWESDRSVAPSIAGGDVDYAPDAPRADSDLVINILLAMAQVKILGTHRHTRPRFSVPCVPEIDVSMALALSSATLTATGKVARVVHAFDMEVGDATSEVTLAVSGVAATGIVTPTPLAPPTPQDIDAYTGIDPWTERLPNLMVSVGGMANHAYSEGIMGFLVNAPATLTATNPTLAQDYSFPNPYHTAGWDYPITGYRAMMPGVPESHRNPVTLEHAQAYDLEIPADSISLAA